MKSRAKKRVQFTLCINNNGYKASLQSGKLYQVVPDDKAACHGYICVIDESGEAYGYSASRFLVTGPTTR
jgi:hypothetical protein